MSTTTVTLSGTSVACPGTNIMGSSSVSYDHYKTSTLLGSSSNTATFTPASGISIGPTDYAKVYGTLSVYDYEGEGPAQDTTNAQSAAFGVTGTLTQVAWGGHTGSTNYSDSAAWAGATINNIQYEAGGAATGFMTTNTKFWG